MTSTPRARLVAALVLGVLLVSCTTGNDAPPTGSATTAVGGGSLPAGATYQATIRRTTDGVPHITGPSLASVTFGQGYANAEDHACTLADQVLKVTSRRAEMLGAGTNNINVNSDFAWKAIGIDALARADWPTQPEPIKQEMTSFVAGWNRYLADTGVDKIKGWCAGQPWVHALTPEDVYTYARSIALNASGSRLTQYLGTAKPPAPAAPASTAADEPAVATPAVASTVGAGTPTGPANATALFDESQPIASNGWAIGADRAGAGGGMLLANPHFPWEGELRFWEVHLTVPGQFDIYGSQLIGVPGVGIGFTEEFAWTHTVSAGNRFTAYTLDLVPGKPTSYKYDDTEKAMTSRDEIVKVKGADGTLEEQKRTLWFSEYGPILDFPGVGWTAAMTTTYRDANIDDDELFGQYLAMNTAKSFDDFKKAHEANQGVPLFNTIAVSKDGRAWYADTSATPNLSKEALAAYEQALASNLITATAANSGAIVLDGSKSLYQWVDEPGARDPGLVPYAKMPQAERRDYVFNANDSFWLDHADAVIEGDYSILHGRQRTARSLRTRENAVVLRDTSATGPSGTDGKFSLDELQQAALRNRSYPASALKDEVVARCKGATVVAVPELKTTDGSAVALPAESVDVTKACQVLESWDGTYDLASRGAHVWREFLSRFETPNLTTAGPLWAQPFDAGKPIDTPSGLAPAAGADPDPVLINLARAVQVITKAGKALDAPLGELQVADRNGVMVPIHGGMGFDGVTNVIGYGSSSSTGEPTPTRGPSFAPRSSLTEKGYLINNGTSFLMAVELTSAGPRAAALLTYGETGDRTSPLFVAQTEKFSKKQWRTVAFRDADITADLQGQARTITQ